MNEIWKNIKGYEGHYQASNLGFIRSIKFNKKLVMSRVFDKDGYVKTQLYLNGVASYFRVHRLVASEFVLNTDNKPEINHIDGNKENNHYKNLEWVTCIENIHHANDNNLSVKGSRVHCSKLNDYKVLKIRSMYSKGNHSHHSLAREFGVSHGNIYKILNRRIWKHI